jgi:hypothetical protein
VAQTVVTSGNLDWNEACMGACTAAAAVLREMLNPVDHVGLKDALGRVFVAFDMTDWESGLMLLCPIGFGVLLWSGLLKATVDVGLRFAWKAQLSTWCDVPHGRNLLQLYRTVLGRSMMQMYKAAVEEDDTHKIHAEVEEGWKLLLRKDGNPRRYRDAILKRQCGYLVEDAIAEFGLRHGVCKNALLSYVQGFLYRRLYEDDGRDPYYSLEGVDL